MILRVRKEDSAFLYQILEASEGLTNYSTLPAEKQSPFREILLHEAPDLRGELQLLLDRLSSEISLEICKDSGVV